MGKILILDTETTGLTARCQVIELGYIEIANELDSMVGPKPHIERFRPSVPINIAAYKVHGITLKDLIRCNRTSTITLPEDIEYLIGHNIIFDIRLLKQSNPTLTEQLDKIKLIDTQALAKVLNKNLTLGFAKVKLDWLIEFYFPDTYKDIISVRHNALGDCVKVSLLLGKLRKYIPEAVTIDDIYNFQQKVTKKCR